ncbi:hypothetical protein PR202_ga10283 [Eleusine coracana subsp. coracana]|uniref:Uncharacterized protein n=1 Tax=Eleusine coracana subsp. coracana TaxID=191504 RepID=A0AAV5C699_ELECO|nr:hypothetical protein PR202_ga10283 [Eleusine coracana subsp. coracana]
MALLNSLPRPRKPRCPSQPMLSLSPSLITFLLLIPFISLLILHGSSFPGSSCSPVLARLAGTSRSSGPGPGGFSGDLRDIEFSWNHLPFSASKPPPTKLKIAVFSRKWPVASAPGGMERPRAHSPHGAGRAWPPRPRVHLPSSAHRGVAVALPERPRAPLPGRRAGSVALRRGVEAVRGGGRERPVRRDPLGERGGVPPVRARRGEAGGFVARHLAGGPALGDLPGPGPRRGRAHVPGLQPQPWPSPCTACSPRCASSAATRTRWPSATPQGRCCVTCTRSRPRGCTSSSTASTRRSSSRTRPWAARSGRRPACPGAPTSCSASRDASSRTRDTRCCTRRSPSCCCATRTCTSSSPGKGHGRAGTWTWAATPRCSAPCRPGSSRRSITRSTCSWTPRCAPRGWTSRSWRRCSAGSPWWPRGSRASREASSWTTSSGTCSRPTWSRCSRGWRPWWRRAPGAPRGVDGRAASTQSPCSRPPRWRSRTRGSSSASRTRHSAPTPPSSTSSFFPITHLHARLHLQ